MCAKLPAASGSSGFTPYGEEHIAQTTTCPQNYKFTGYERDSETGLDYAFVRYYDSRLGRFMAADPMGGDTTDPQTLNRYAYVRNSPPMYVDPFGLKLCAITNDDGSIGYIDTTEAGCKAKNGVIVNVNQGIIVNGNGPSTDPTYGGNNGDNGIFQWWSDFFGALKYTPSFSSVVKQVNQCAASTADSHSVAAVTHTQNVPVVRSLLSNYFSSASQLFFGPNRSGGAASLGTNAASLGLGAANKAAGTIPVGSGMQFLMSSVPATTFAETAVGKLAIGATAGIADVATGEAEAQVLYDAGVYGTALVTCATK